MDVAFLYLDPIPCCRDASIGQARRAILKETSEEVIIKVQYPNAAWQVPADIQCIGDLLNICV
jgi:predicted unusual protein kinase regulating ubiquinone biosynthesis (AarF/ABC1/UbiB family)